MKTTKAELKEALRVALSILDEEAISIGYEYGESDSVYQTFPIEMKILAPFARVYLSGEDYKGSIFEYILEIEGVK